jgi:hypothetical protein
MINKNYQYAVIKGDDKFLEVKIISEHDSGYEAYKSMLNEFA